MNSIVDFVVGIIKLLIFASLVIGVVVFCGYNKIRRLAESVKEALANVSISTRKKVGLVNQLKSLAFDYQRNEQLTMLKISDDITVSSMQLANQQSGQILAAINAMAQRFPELKANQPFNLTMDGIREAELSLEAARNRYNQVAREYNVTRTSLPHVFYSQLLGFNPAQYLTPEATESRDAEIERSFVSDDGERVNELLARAGTKVFAVAKSIAEQGRALAEKGAARVQHSSPAGFHDHGTDKNAKASGGLGMPQCPNCGQSLASGEKFCPNCGTSSPTSINSAQKSCPSCGATNPATARFCKECGKPVLGEAQAQA